MNSTVLITDCDMGDAVLEREVLEAAGVRVVHADARTEDDVIRSVAETGATGLLVQYAPITRAVLEACPAVQGIVRYGVGLDTIDLEAASDLEVAVSNVPHYGSNEVADHAVTLLLALLRGVPWWSDATRRHGWPARGELQDPLELSQQTLGLVGFGAIARAVARRAQAFGITVIATDPFAEAAAFDAAGVRAVDRDELWSSSTAVSLHAPLIESTRGAVDATTLSLLPAGSVLVNTARAGLVDRGALEAALDSGTLAAFGTDVWWDEPASPTDSLAAHPRVLLTPHVAWLSPGSILRLRKEAAEILRDMLI